MAIDQTGFFLDFQRFSDLKLDARANSEDATRSVARQFEGLFVQQMLAAMRSAAKIDAGQHSSYMEFYQDMYDKQLAQVVAGQDRLGVARLMLQQMPSADAAADTAPPAAALQQPEIAIAQRPPAKPAADASTVTAAATATAAAPVVGAGRAAAAASGAATAVAKVVLSRVSDHDFAEVMRNQRVNERWQQPQNFVADLLPQAREVAPRLGISAELLVAQAALETGWGKHTMKFDDGRNSYNLFGIKAGGDWRGNALQRNSLEFRDGALVNQLSRFRAYDSPAHSLADYADFIHSNPRYQQALAQRGDDHAYIRAIHEAGYATDPDYADKVIGILHGELLQQSLASINPGVSDHA